MPLFPRNALDLCRGRVLYSSPVIKKGTDLTFSAICSKLCSCAAGAVISQIVVALTVAAGSLIPAIAAKPKHRAAAMVRLSRLGDFMVFIYLI